MDIVFTGIADISVCNAAIWIQSGITTEVFLHGIGHIAQFGISRIQLTAIDGIGWSLRNQTCCHILDATLFADIANSHHAYRSFTGKTTIGQLATHSYRLGDCSVAVCRSAFGGVRSICA